jgi:conjugal transfer pilus assembly protein TraW
MNISMKIFFLSIMLVGGFETAAATDFGKYGQTFIIAEESFIAMLKKRLDNIDLEQEKQKIQARAKTQVENPNPVSSISPATQSRIFYFDPSYILDKDAILPCGKILHKAGTKVNPLERMDLNRRMFFIDARQETQIFWLKEMLNNPLPKQIEDRVILIGGNIFKLKENLGENHTDKIYFDQVGELTTKFGIKATPAIVMQDGSRLKIEEVELGDASCKY